MARPERRSVLALIGCAAVAASALPLYALAAPDVSRAPDLRADPVERVAAPQVYLDGQVGTGADRLLVRFDGFVTNVGGGPLEIRGDPQLSQSAAGGVKQYALAAGAAAGSTPAEAVATPEVRFESADGHDHFHLMRAMRYSLWNLSGTAEVAPGQKVGFCLYDLDDGLAAPAPQPAPQVYTEAVTQFCDSGDPESTDLRMGVSSGWRDVYDRDLAFQWVDVSSTPPGVYLVGSQADPDGAIWEGGGAGPETNPRTLAPTRVTVPGHVAEAVRVAQTGAPRSIPLASRSFGAPGPVRYAIVDGPDHGTLDQATGGRAFEGPAVTYTPEAGYSGADAFSFVAIDATSPFPLEGSAPRATVSITAAAPSITISGAPAQLIAGTGVQLSAIVAHAGGGVTWSASAGSISPGGLYVAPATPPPGGVVTVRATSDSVGGLAAEATISIAPAPPAAPAPVPPAAVTAPPPAKLLSKLTFARAGGRAVVATLTTGRRAGRVTVTVTRGPRVVGRCGARVTANRTVSCRIVVPRRFPLPGIRATATIAFGGRVAAVRRATLAPPLRRG